jgi:Zn-dependent peptidase ImmA (M78 family)
MEDGKLEKLTIAEVFDVISQYRILIVDCEKIGLPICKRTAFGYCDYDTKTIYVDGDRNQSTVVRTLMHEISHAYHYMNCLDDSERNTGRVEKATWEDYKQIRGLK